MENERPLNEKDIEGLKYGIFHKLKQEVSSEEEKVRLGKKIDTYNTAKLLDIVKTIDLNEEEKKIEIALRAGAQRERN